MYICSLGTLPPPCYERVRIPPELEGDREVEVARLVVGLLVVSLFLVVVVVVVVPGELPHGLEVGEEGHVRADRGHQVRPEQLHLGRVRFA